MSISFYSHQHLIGPVLLVGKTFLSPLHCLSSLVRDQSAGLYGFLFVQIMALKHLGADDSQFIHGAWTSPLERNMPAASVNFGATLWPSIGTSSTHFGQRTKSL